MTKEEKREYYKRYNIINKEKIQSKRRAYFKEYNLKNKESRNIKMREYTKQYYIKNKEKVKEYNKEYRNSNKKKYQEYSKSYYDGNVVRIDYKKYNKNTCDSDILPLVEMMLGSRQIKQRLKTATAE